MIAFFFMILITDLKGIEITIFKLQLIVKKFYFFFLSLLTVFLNALIALMQL
jgi:hypothetical protein